MYLETTASNIRSALGLLSGIVERRNTIPVLGTVKIADGKIVATNLDMEATVCIPTLGKMKGAAAIDYARLSSLAGHIQPDENVTIQVDDGLASIGFNGSRYTAPSISASDFPEFDDVSGERSDIGNAGLVAAIRRVRFAILTEETRYYLNGVALIENADGEAFAVATDGHRLAIQPISFMPSAGKGQIIPRGLITYLCGRKVEPKAVTFSGGKPRVQFDFDGLVVKGKLIDGTYPDIWRAVPKEPVHYLSADRAKMLTVLKRIAAFVGAGGNDWRGVKLTGDGEKLTLTAERSAESASETIPAQCSEPFAAGYNIRYLVDAVSALTGETVSLASEKGQIAGAPATITSNDDDLRVVLMPMRI